MAQPPTATDPKALMAGVREGLGLAVQPDLAPGWRAVGLVLALQGALALSLTAYDTAEPADVLDPAARSDAPRLAPVALLLRRAGSPDYLADPERLVLSRSDRRALATLVELRNRLLHPLARPLQPDAAALAPLQDVATRVLDHLLIRAPAFDPASHALDLAAIRDDLREVAGAPAPGPASPPP